MSQAPTPPVPQVMSANGMSVGARTPPSSLALYCAPACAISGYETGDLTDGMFEGSALIAFLLSCCCCCAGGLYALFSWKPDPSAIRGDGTQRTVHSKCTAGCCISAPMVVSFWESGDMMCVDGECAWLEGDGMVAFILQLIGCGLCFVMCCWNPSINNFKRSLSNNGGGMPLTGAPMLSQAGNVSLGRLQQSGTPMPASQSPGVAGLYAGQPGMGQPLIAQPVVQAVYAAPAPQVEMADMSMSRRPSELAREQAMQQTVETQAREVKVGEPATNNVVQVETKEEAEAAKKEEKKEDENEKP